MTTLTRTAGPRGLRRLGHAVLAGLTYPHGVSGYQDAYRPGVAAGRVAAEVVAVTPRTPRAHSLLLRPQRPLTFAPGQHVLLTCQIEGRRQTRCYSLSDTPHRPDGLLEVTVAHIPDGLVSSHLVSGLPAGTDLGISAPQGHDFVLPLPRPQRLLLIGGGSGITPLRSMWRTMQAEGLGDRVTLLHYARTLDDALFADELASMSGAHLVLTRESAGGALEGRFGAHHLARLGLQPAQLDAFTCGPRGLTDAVTEAFADAGASGHLRTESFAPPAAPAADDDCDGMLTFTRAGASARNDGRTLLEQAEAAGLTPASGCRMGICHTCTTTKLAGVVTDVRNGECSTDGTEEVQLCISAPAGDVALEL